MITELLLEVKPPKVPLKKTYRKRLYKRKSRTLR